MKSNNILGAIVAGCLMVIAFAIVTNPDNYSTQSTEAAPVAAVIYAPVESMPVREVIRVDKRQLECMALNVYFEARNQSTVESMAAVAYTVLNRVAAPRFPNNICDVVFQGRRDASGNYVRHRCQFSWVCDGKADRPNLNHPVEAEAWHKSVEVAMKVLTGDIDNPIGNATMYHATYVKPHWARAYMLVAQVEDHIFYEKGAKNG